MGNISDTDSTIAILMNALEVRDYRPENDALQLRDLVLILPDILIIRRKIAAN